MVTVTVHKTGFAIYIDGVLKYDQTNTAAWACDSGVNSDGYDYNLALNTVREADYFYLNHGAFWNFVDTKFSDLSIFNRALTASEVVELYEITKK